MVRKTPGIWYDKFHLLIRQKADKILILQDNLMQGEEVCGVRQQDCRAPR